MIKILDSRSGWLHLLVGDARGSDLLPGGKADTLSGTLKFTAPDWLR
jgi:hypothetical protein